MSEQVSDDVLMGGDGATFFDASSDNPQSRVAGPRVLIQPSGPIPVRPHPDNVPTSATFDWVADKESELAGKDKKARRKEKKKQKLAESQPKPTAAKPEIVETAPKGKKPEAQAIKKSPKAAAPADATKTKPGGQKRKNTADEEEAKKRLASQKGPSEGPANIKLAPPIKRKDMTQEQRSAQNKAKRAAHKLKKKGGAKDAEKQPAEETEGVVDAAAEAEKQRALNSRYDNIYQDGLTAWVNHPSLSSEGNDFVYVLVARKVKEVAKAAHPQSIIEFTNVNRAGWHATVIRCASEAIRKLVTDSRLAAKLDYKEKTHHLQIQPYKGGGNKIFTVSSLGPFSGNPSLAITAIEKAYATTNFGCWQYYDELADFRHDMLLVQFLEPPKTLVKELDLLPDAKPGYKVKMAPYSIAGRCRNPSCGKVIHSRMCPAVKTLKVLPVAAPEAAPEGAESAGDVETSEDVDAPEVEGEIPTEMEE